ncbi:MAG: efflux RND transporter periplasmic adaptor subunit [Candidatus Hydrogenedentota bacterium]|nr:MAG: efflux RND transporter periplasmic adaptor subunit [Candidatus Hydrogenedentota bacterium]
MRTNYKPPLISARELACVFALGSILLFSSCSKSNEKLASASEPRPEFAVSVKVAHVVRSGIKSTIHAVGAVKALNQAKISAKIPAKVERILVEEGDSVRAGETLLQLEKTDLMLTVRQAEAAVNMAEANFSKAETEWARAQELHEKGIASQQHYDLAKSTFDVAEASVKQAKADLGLAEHQLDNADVTTLFGGTVTHRYVDLGERVSPGQPLLEVAQIDPVEVEIGVSDKRFSELKLGQSVTITVDGYPRLEFKGEVKKIQPAIDPMTRTFKVTVGVANPEELLKPGMFGRAEIEIGYHPDALVVPRAATLEEEGKYYTVAVRNNKAHRVEVALGFQDGERVEVLSGLSEGERVVLEGAYALAQGAPVQISGE